MKLFAGRMLLLLFASCFSLTAAAQQSFFRDAPEAAFAKTGAKRVVIPNKYRTLQLDTAGMLPFLRLLPSEQTLVDRSIAPVLALPMPDGSVARFHVWESSAMAPELAAAYPELKTFTGQGIDDPTATIKLDWTEFGFHAMILSPVSGRVFIDPYDQQTRVNYISYYDKDKKKATFTELPPLEYKGTSARPADILAGQCTGTQLRTYRLAISCTVEYARAATGLTNPTKAQALSKVIETVNRVNGVYETDLTIRMVLVANDTAVLYTSGTDPFTNNDGAAMLSENQTIVDSRIGSANYDIGHIFSTWVNGGVASLGVVCLNGAKARGVTGSPTPTGVNYDIDFVAHEMGHQFGASHTFNNASSCGVTAADQNTEPGSGVSIMGYAGVCANDNLANHSIPNFHAISQDAINGYAVSGSGNSCAVRTNTGNSLPVVNAGSNYTIPKSTPFVLTGTATDANDGAGSLTYSWEEVDIAGPNGASTAPSGNAPLFRSFVPQTSSTRYFPKLSDVIANITSVGERLPNYARSMNFRLTVRDNRAGGGGVCFDQTVITVDGNSGPLAVTAPNTAVAWTAGDFKTVAWDVAGTTNAPVNCANVSIQLSTDGGNTFPITIAASTPNDGSEEIVVPNNISTTARIRIMAVGNVFYDISNSNFTIQAAPAPTFVFNNPAPANLCVAAPTVDTLKTSAMAGFSTNINLSASLNPAGTTVSFGTNPVAPGGFSTVTLNNITSLDPGVYTIRVTGTAGSIVKTRDLQFRIGTPTTDSLIAPANNATGLSKLPVFTWATVGAGATYRLEISPVSDFSVIEQIIPDIAGTSHTLTFPLSENTEYFWRIRTTNACGLSDPTATPNRFKTGISTCRASTDVNVSISQSGTPSVTSVLIIPAELGVAVTDLNVTGLNITHTRVSDLTIKLTAPNGDTAILLSQVCSGTFANFNINLDDQAATGTVPCPPNTGAIIQPANPLSVFNGLNSAGTWTLTVKDNLTGSGGTINGWGLNINGATATGCSIINTPLLSSYTFTGDGNWSDPANWSGNTVPPNPLPSGSNIVINHVDGGQCILDIAQTISSGATLTVPTGKNLVIPGVLTVQ